MSIQNIVVSCTKWAASGLAMVLVATGCMGQPASVDGSQAPIEACSARAYWTGRTATAFSDAYQARLDEIEDEYQTCMHAAETNWRDTANGCIQNRDASRCLTQATGERRLEEQACGELARQDSDPSEVAPIARDHALEFARGACAELLNAPLCTKDVSTFEATTSGRVGFYETVPGSLKVGPLTTVTCNWNKSGTSISYRISISQ